MFNWTLLLNDSGIFQVKLKPLDLDPYLWTAPGPDALDDRPVLRVPGSRDPSAGRSYAAPTPRRPPRRNWTPAQGGRIQIFIARARVVPDTNCIWSITLPGTGYPARNKLFEYISFYFSLFLLCKICSFFKFAQFFRFLCAFCYQISGIRPDGLLANATGYPARYQIPKNSRSLPSRISGTTLLIPWIIQTNQQGLPFVICFLKTW